MNQDKKLKIYKRMTFLLIIILAVIGIIWGKDKLAEQKAGDKYDKLSQQVNDVNQSAPDSSTQTEFADTQQTEANQEETETETDILAELGINVPEKNLDWDMLHKENSDIYAWIYIPNTNVDYPILQHPTNDAYYLDHNLDGSSGYPACIYTELANTKDFSDANTVIYGHNLKSGKMFRTLHNFEDETFFNDNSYIYIYTERGVLVYEIFAAYTSDDAHILKTNDFSTAEGYQSYLDAVLDRRDLSANFRDKEKVTNTCRIITLSTCTSRSDERYLVQAFLLNDNFK